MVVPFQIAAETINVKHAVHKTTVKLVAETNLILIKNLNKN